MAKTSKKQSAQARDLDKVIHEKTRLGIMTTLAANPNGILFTDLKQLNELTDGNLNRHLKVLADADLVKSTKSNKAERGRNSKTTYRLTKAGLAAFVDYLNQMEQVLRRASAATGQVTSTKTTNTKNRLATGN